MAKDKGGHGSEKRGGAFAGFEAQRQALKDKAAAYEAKFGRGNTETDAAIRKGFAAQQAAISDKQAAGALSQGHPKSGPVANAWGQYPKEAAQVRSQLRSDRKMQLNKPP